VDSDAFCDAFGFQPNKLLHVMSDIVCANYQLGMILEVFSNIAVMPASDKDV